ncbi:hypothetical protein [Microbispora rosea]|nr:hypothetical protein [Microbispora rosea]GIH48433.1 hypothetical protein Mro03_36120 [Microbispora rosea subsp. rosea]
MRLLGMAGHDMLDGWQPAPLGALALMFVVTGVPHFLPSWRRDFVAMFSANVLAARRGLTLAGKPVTPLLARTALQVLFVAAAVAAAV